MSKFHRMQGKVERLRKNKIKRNGILVPNFFGLALGTRKRDRDTVTLLYF